MEPNQRLRRALLGYRRAEVDVALAELRLTVRHLQDDLQELRERAGSVEEELRETRVELDGRRAREAEVAQSFEAAQQRVREIEQSAEASARAILAEAQEHASKTRAEGHLRSEAMSGQVDELLRLRDSLVETMRGVIRDFDYAVERVEKGDTVFPEEQPPPLAMDSPQPVRKTRPAGPEDEQLFDERVEIEAGPFGDFASLSAFERALSRLPKVADIYVRRFSGDRALIELATSEPMPLLAAMRDLPYELQVQSIERGRLVVSLQPVAAGTA